MSNKTDDFDASELSANLSALREDVGRLSDALAALVRAQAEAASATVKGVVNDAKDQFSQAASSVHDSATSATADLERRIEKNPLTAVLIAAGIGLVVGMMSRSRG